MALSPLFPMIAQLLWNIHGVGNDVSLRRLKYLIRENCITFLVILEPMLQGSDPEKIKRKLKFDVAHRSCTDKIWIFHQNSFSANIVSESDQGLHFKVTHPIVESPFFFLFLQSMPGVQELSANLCGIIFAPFACFIQILLG